MNRFLSYIVLTALLFTSVRSHAELAIYKEETTKGIHSYVGKYGVSGYWRVNASTKTTGRDTGYRSCDIDPTDRTRYPRTGHFKTINAPDFTIINSPENGKWVSMTIPGRLRVGTTLKVGGESFDYVRDHFTKIPNDIVLKFARLFISESRAEWTTEGKSSSVSLVGFTDAWNYCVKYVDFNPFMMAE